MSDESEIAVDVRPDMNPRAAGGYVATASVECPKCHCIASITIRGISKDRATTPARIQTFLRIKARQAAEQVVLTGGCAPCQLQAEGWTFKPAPSLAMVQ